jgi:hypothetical protein
MLVLGTLLAVAVLLILGAFTISGTVYQSDGVTVL